MVEHSWPWMESLQNDPLQFRLAKPMNIRIDISGTPFCRAIYRCWDISMTYSWPVGLSDVVSSWWSFIWIRFCIRKHPDTMDKSINLLPHSFFKARIFEAKQLAGQSCSKPKASKPSWRWDAWWHQRPGTPPGAHWCTHWVTGWLQVWGSGHLGTQEILMHHGSPSVGFTLGHSESKSQTGQDDPTAWIVGPRGQNCWPRHRLILA